MSTQETGSSAASVSIPLEVKSAYTPSGGVEPGRLPLLIVGGIVGLLIGALCVAGVAIVGELLYRFVTLTDKSSSIVFFFVFAVFYGSPLMLPIMTGVMLGKFSRPAMCRNLSTMTNTAFIFSLVNAGLIWVIGLQLRAYAEVNWGAYLENMEWLSSSAMAGRTGDITMLAIAGLGLIITSTTAGAAVLTAKFCEGCRTYLKREVYSRVSLTHLPKLQEALAQLDLAQVAAIPKLPEKPKWSSTDERVDVILYACPCQATSFIEAEIVWTEVTQGSKTGKRRLIFSAFLHPEAATQLEAPAAPVVPTAPADEPTLPPAAPPVDLQAQEFEAQRKQEIARQEEETSRAFKRKARLKLGLIMVMAGAFGLYSLYKTIDYYGKVHYPTTPGTITAVAEGKFMEDRVTITTPDRKQHLAMVRQNSFKQMGKQVQFHYSGKPEAEVLIVGEENPLSFTIFLLGMAALCYLIMHFYLRKKPA